MGWRTWADDLDRRLLPSRKPVTAGPIPRINLVLLTLAWVALLAASLALLASSTPLVAVGPASGLVSMTIMPLAAIRRRRLARNRHVGLKPPSQAKAVGADVPYRNLAAGRTYRDV